jgi:hypothetical protein
MVGNLIHRKTENTIIKKTKNGWQPNTEKNRQYNYHCLSFFIILLSVFLCIRLPTIVCLFYNCIVCFSVYDVANHCLSFLSLYFLFFCVLCYKKRKTMVGTLIHRKTDNTIIKKTNNGRQTNTQKNRQYNYKKRQTMHCLSFLQLYFLFFSVLGWRPLFVFFYNCIVYFSVY